MWYDSFISISVFRQGITVSGLLSVNRRNGVSWRFFYCQGFYPKRVEIYFIAGDPRRKDGYSMIKMIVTKAVISKGYDGAPALRYSESTENPSVRFRIGCMVYDKRAENNHRFVNINVKAFGYLVDRVNSMNLDAGSILNIVGRYDEESWDDKLTGEKRSASVLIADEIEYGTVNNGKQSEARGGTTNGTPASNGQIAPQPTATNGQPPGNFTGFQGFGDPNPYFPEG